MNDNLQIAQKEKNMDSQQLSILKSEMHTVLENHVQSSNSQQESQEK